MSKQPNINVPRVSMPNIRGGVIGMFILIIILGIAASTMFKFAQVDEGQRGIIVTQGAVEGVQEPGIFFRLFAPFTHVETCLLYTSDAADE